MVVPPRQTLGDYCRRTDSGKICLGFQLANHVTFDIKNYVLTCLKENLFDGQAIRDPWEHLAKFYETCSMCNPIFEITDDQIKLCLFGFLLTGRVKDWLQCIPNGTIQTWKELEDMFFERYYSNAQFMERKDAITSFSQEET